MKNNWQSIFLIKKNSSRNVFQAFYQLVNDNNAALLVLLDFLFYVLLVCFLESKFDREQLCIGLLSI